MHKISFYERVEFILKIGSALHRYGTPAHQLESALDSISQKLDIQSDFFSTPTAIMASMRTSQNEVTRILRVQPGSVDLGKLSALDKLGDDAIAGSISIADSAKKVDNIVQRRSFYPQPLIAFSHGVSSLGIACIFQAHYSDLLWSFIVGTVIGLLHVLAQKSGKIARLYEALSAFLAAIISSVAAHFDPTVSVPTVLLAGIISVLPGLTLTIALNELATQNLISGTARFMGALVTLLKTIFGVILGTTILARFISPPNYVEGPNAPDIYVWVGLMLAALASIVIFKAHKKDRIWVVLASVVGFISAKLGTIFLGPTLGVFIGGFVIGSGSNLFARLLQRPSQIIVVPGIVLLVPGAIGYKSLVFFSQNDAVKGIDNGFTMFLVGITIVAGLIFGNVFISPRRNL